MSVLSKSRAAFALLFIAGIFCASAWNLHTESRDILAGISGMRMPRTVQDLRDASAKLQRLAERNLAGKYEAWAAHASIQAALGKSEMNDFSVLKGPDGKLYRGGLYPMHLENARKLAGEVAEFAAKAAAKGAKVVYVNTPDTIAKGMPGLSAEWTASMPVRDYNIVQDAFLNTLRERGVAYLDTRYPSWEQGPGSGLGPEDMTIKTGFLLSGKGGFAVFTRMLDGLRQKASVDLDPDGFYRDPAKYAMAERPEFFLGEMGKETGPGFSGLDAFTSVAPAFATSLHYEALDMFGNFVKAEGGAEETILNPDALMHRQNVYTLYPQSYYRHTNTAWSSVKNKLTPGGPKVLVIHDFYTAQIISHLAPLCGEMHTLAHQYGFPLNASEYMQNNDFDYVIVSFFSQNLLRPEMRSLMTGKE